MVAEKEKHQKSIAFFFVFATKMQILILSAQTYNHNYEHNWQFFCYFYETVADEICQKKSHKKVCLPWPSQ